MTTTVAKLIALVGFVAGMGIGCEPAQCTPEEHGLQDATRLTPRSLVQKTISSERACAKAGVTIISSEAELRAFLDELAPSTNGTAAYPTVDFDRERVLVREGVGGEGIAWAVVKGETSVVGLLACGGTPESSCAVDVVAVPAIIARVEARKCNPVGCGPTQPPPRARPQ